MINTLQQRRVAHLRLQPVLPICKKAIASFEETIPGVNKPRINVFANGSTAVWAWIDNDLFEEALAMLLHHLYKFTDFNQQSAIILQKTGASTCRILISRHRELRLTECDGLITTKNWPWNVIDLEKVQHLFEMHGGYLQIWRRKGALDLIFEICVLCVNQEL
jgi:hypothetical protein